MIEGLTLKRDGRVPLGEQLEEVIERRVRDGRFAPGEALPTVRSLAADLGLNYNTVAAAYRSLERRGFLELRRGGGTRVAADPPAPSARERLLESVAGAVLEQVRRAGLAPDDFADAAARLARAGPADPRRVLVVAETQARADELVSWFIQAPLGLAPRVEVRAVALEDFRRGEPHDLVVTEAAVVELAREGRPKPAPFPRRVRPHAHRRDFLRLAEGAD